jgi:hypothetical protein
MVAALSRITIYFPGVRYEWQPVLGRLKAYGVRIVTCSPAVVSPALRPATSMGNGLVAIQGWASMFRLTGDGDMAAFVFELADWALRYQLVKNGAFLVDYHTSRPSFDTACVLEGIAKARAIAAETGDGVTRRAYRTSWKQGTAFMDRLIVREEDTFAMPNPRRSLGGVRESLTASLVRIDYMAHSLLALVKGAN